MILISLIPALYLILNGSYNTGIYLNEIIERYYSDQESTRDANLGTWIYYTFFAEETNFKEKLTLLGNFSGAIVGLLILIIIMTMVL